MPDLTEVLSALHAETVAMRKTLTAFVATNAARLDGLIYETIVGQVPPAAGGTAQTDRVESQTSSIEVITGILAIVPVGTTLAALDLGELVLPLQSTTELIAPIQLKLMHHKRSITWTPPAQTTPIGATVIFWGYAAPASNAPGRLH